MSDYEWLVELAAKALAQRDTYPMPASVSTPEAFYEVMARAALDAIGLRTLLEEVARHEDDLKLDSDPPEEDVDPPVEAVADETGICALRGARLFVRLRAGARDGPARPGRRRM